MTNESFGQALKRLREAADLSQSTLARRAYINQGNLSRYEADRQRPTAKTAEVLDGVLDANGELARLATTPGEDALNPDQRERLAVVMDRPHRLDGGTVEALAGVLATQRRLDDTLGPAPLLPVTLAQQQLVETLVKQTAGPHRAALAEVAAEWTQFVGWLYASLRQDAQALRWLAEAEQAADEIENGVLAAQAANFRGYVARQQGNWRGVVRWFLAEHSTPGASVHQQIGAAAQAAQGAGRLGDRDGARRMLDTADTLLEQASQNPAPRTAYWLDSNFHRLNLGLANLSLGAYDVAADHLNAALNSLPADQRGAAWTVEYREALAAANSQM
ncbi:helix-turn-helix transcriptional regulator [Saccharopolyspora sp. TS4A08]|uniref:Helix-turn-helix transcriptional regulator n=1 Tax=Saccharopolyspora ipomoeae TaxID=3042027 RepID=A0ABT6PVH3_9PSEU|nr:helix-turn-helix transcriptional regulator [Saccharopolyspora sp. TS4A08]MDI2032012.1 helix-turn-helix transcriptional regulator [Saccharopolyspora sp. TS4A08]